MNFIFLCLNGEMPFSLCYFFGPSPAKIFFLLRSKFFSKQDCQGSKEQSLLKQNNPNLIQNCWLFNFRLHPLDRPAAASRWPGGGGRSDDVTMKSDDRSGFCEFHKRICHFEATLLNACALHPPSL